MDHRKINFNFNFNALTENWNGNLIVSEVNKLSAYFRYILLYTLKFSQRYKMFLTWTMKKVLLNTWIDFFKVESFNKLPKFQEISLYTFYSFKQNLLIFYRSSELEFFILLSLKIWSILIQIFFFLNIFRGILQQEQGRYEEALQSYKLAIQFRPRLASKCSKTL